METLDPKSPNHILVGIGGTGGKVLKAIRKRLYQEFPNDEERDNLSIGFVYVDSTREMMTPGDPSFRVMGKDASFTESEFVDIKSVDLKQILDNVSNYPGLKGIVKNGASMKNTLGEVGQAAGQRQLRSGYQPADGKFQRCADAGMGAGRRHRWQGNYRKSDL